MGLFSIFSKKEKKETLDAGLEKTKASFLANSHVPLPENRKLMMKY